MKLIYVFCLIFLNFVFVNAEGILNEAMQKGIVKLGEACMKTVGASMDEMNELRSGPPYQGKTACVVACIFDKAGIMEKKKFSKQGFIHTTFPFVFSDPIKLKRMQEIAGNCEKEIKTLENECETANSIITCLRKNIPQIAEIKF